MIYLLHKCSARYIAFAIMLWGVCTAVFFFPAILIAGGASPFPSIVWDPTQISASAVNSANQITEMARQAQQLEMQISNQISQIEHQIRDLSPKNQSVYSTIQDSMYGLTQIIEQSKGLAYGLSQQDMQFAALYPEYNQQFQGVEPYSQQYINWNQQVRDGVENAFEMHGIIGSSTEDIHQLTTMIEVSNNAQGTLQVMQAANEIAALLVKQLMQLQHIDVANGQALNAYLAQMSAEYEAKRSLHAHAVGSLSNEQGKVNYTYIQGYSQLPPLH